MSNDLLQVPHRLHLADGYCLPACVQMVLAYWGIEQDQHALALQMGTIPDSGTPGPRVKRLASRSLDVSYGEGMMDDLRSALERGIPPIALVHTGELPYWDESTAHALVIVGMDDASIWVNDPGQLNYPIKVSLGDFQLAWDELVNRFVILEIRR